MNTRKNIRAIFYGHPSLPLVGGDTPANIPAETRELGRIYRIADERTRRYVTCGTIIGFVVGIAASSAPYWAPHLVQLIDHLSRNNP